jgi:hypothetical protein
MKDIVFSRIISLFIELSNSILGGNDFVKSNRDCKKSG